MQRFLFFSSLFLYVSSVRASLSNSDINLQGSSRKLHSFSSIPPSSSEELQRERRRLAEDRRVNEQRTNPFPNSQDERNPFTSVDTPRQPLDKNPLFPSNEENIIQGFQRPDSSFRDRAKTISDSNSGQRVGSRRPSTSYTNISPPNNRLPTLRTGRRLEADRNVNSKNENPLGSTRISTNNIRNEDDASRNQVGGSSQNQGRMRDEVRGRNRDQFNRNNQVGTNTIQDQTIKRPSINYRTLLDNDLRSTNEKKLFQKGMFIVRYFLDI